MEDLTNKELIKLDVIEETKEETIKSLADLIAKQDRLTSVNEYYETLFAREEKSSTGIGNQIAIPHGKSSSVKQPTIAFARLKKGVDWEAIDDDPVKLVFLLAIPEASKSDDHLKILATLSRNLLNDDFKEQLLTVETKEEVNSILNQMLH